MVPKQFEALLSRHDSRQKEADYRAGVVAALIANSVPSKKRRRPSKPEDFFPRLKRKRGGAE